jgi:hypothetical protein
MKHIYRFCMSAVMAVAVLNAATLWAEPTAEQQEKAKAIEMSLQKFRSFYTAKQYKEANDLLGEVQGSLADLEASGTKEELASIVDPISQRLAAAQRLMAGKASEITVDPKAPKTTPKKPLAKQPLKNVPMPPAGGGVSFVKDVAPILVAKCGTCHVRQTRGGFSVASYDELKKGSSNGVVFQPGKASGSVLMESLESGDMPRGSGMLPANELAIISKWIDAGAVFDGADPKANISTLVPGAAAAMDTTVPLVQATGKESVLFIRDLAPVIVERCIGCHGGADPAQRLNLDTFAGLLRGGQNGKIVVPGNPKDSLLIQKLHGTAKDGQRMPLRDTPLAKDVIAKFEKWVSEGAKYDGRDQRQSIDLAVRIMIARKMTHEELSKHRVGLATKSWALGNPSASPSQIESENVLTVGNISPVRLTEVSEAAEAMHTKIAAFVKHPPGKPFLKGRLTVFAFDKPYNYSEYGQMVEKRNLPPGWHGHWRFNVIDAYTCVIPAKDDVTSINAVLAEGMGGAYVESLAEDVPAWFSKGSGRNIAANMDKKGSAFKEWDEGIGAAMVGAKKPESFLTDSCDTGETAVLSYGFVKSLMRGGGAGRYQGLLNDMRKGMTFEQAFVKAYGADPKTVAAGWWKAG